MFLQPDVSTAVFTLLYVFRESGWSSFKVWGFPDVSPTAFTQLHVCYTILFKDSLELGVSLMFFQPFSWPIFMHT